jgi:hypothetical protein
VPSFATPAKLHQVLQIDMGWTNSHLHRFDVAGVHFGMPDEDWPELSRRDDRPLTLAGRLGDRDTDCEYDFGDGWEHPVHVEAMLPAEEIAHYPFCTCGANACPPEDVGGPPGYFELLRAMRDPTRADHREWLRWCGGAL